MAGGPVLSVRAHTNVDAQLFAVFERWALGNPRAAAEWHDSAVGGVVTVSALRILKYQCFATAWPQAVQHQAVQDSTIQ